MNKNRQKTKRWKITLTVLIVIVAILSAVCVIYLNDYYCADAAASEALKSDDEVKVEWNDDNKIAFLPKEPESGLIFYPGGKQVCSSEIGLPVRESGLILPCGASGRWVSN